MSKAGIWSVDSAGVTRIKILPNGGIMLDSGGSASAPAIVPESDPNTGLFFPSADVVALAAGGVETIRSSASLITTTQPIRLPGDPSNALDAATKQYVDAVAGPGGSKWKNSVRAATTADITLSGEQTIDGVSVVSGNRVLVKNQSTASQNGLYTAASGAWSRAADADTWDELVAAACFVEEGTTQADYAFVCTVNAGGTLGTTAVTWAQFDYRAITVDGQGIELSGSNVLSLELDGSTLSKSASGVRVNDNLALTSLVVNGTTSAINTTPGSGTATTSLQKNQTSGESALLAYSSGGSNYLSFYTNEGGAAATEKVRITPAGRLQIVQAGSASAPAVSFTGDDDTGLYSISANTLGFATNGVERSRIDSSGNLRLGTTAAQLVTNERLTVDFGSTSESQTATAGAFRKNQTSDVALTGAQSALQTQMSRTVTVNTTDTAEVRSLLIGGSFFGSGSAVLSNTNATGVSLLRISNPTIIGGGLNATHTNSIFVEGYSTNTGTNKYGIRIGNLSGSTNNFSIHTGTGIVRLGDQVQSVNGSASVPQYSFIDDTDTGVFRSAADTLGFATGGGERATITSGGQFLLNSGTVSLPAYSWSGDPDTGIFRPSADAFAFVTAGSERGRVNASGQLVWISGSASAPAWGFGVDTDTGFFRPGADTVALTTGGTERLRINELGNVGINVTAPHSRLHTSGSIATSITSISSSTTLDEFSHTVLVDASAGANTITLPTAVGITGRQYVIKKTDSSTNAVTIATTSSQTIDGASSTTLAAQHETITVVSNGSNWVVSSYVSHRRLTATSSSAETTSVTGNGLVYSAISVTLTRGTWLVQGNATLSNTDGPDALQLLLVQGATTGQHAKATVTGWAVPGSYSAVFQGATYYGPTTPMTVITVTSDTVIRLAAIPNGGTQLRIGFVGGGLDSDQNITAIRLT